MAFKNKLNQVKKKDWFKTNPKTAKINQSFKDRNSRMMQMFSGKRGK